MMTLQELVDQIRKQDREIVDMLHSITDGEVRYIAAYYFKLYTLGSWLLTDVKHQRMVINELNARGLT